MLKYFVKVQTPTRNIKKIFSSQTWALLFLSKHSKAWADHYFPKMSERDKEEIIEISPHFQYIIFDDEIALKGVFTEGVHKIKKEFMPPVVKIDDPDKWREKRLKEIDDGVELSLLPEEVYNRYRLMVTRKHDK